MKESTLITKQLKEAIKVALFPLLTNAGFEKKSGAPKPEYRRMFSGKEQYLIVHWEKYGAPRFIVLFGPVDPIKKDGLLWTYRRARLSPRQSVLTGGWFRADEPWFKKLISKQTNKRHNIQRTVDQLVQMWPEVLDWLENENQGPHVFITDETLRFKPGFAP